MMTDLASAAASAAQNRSEQQGKRPSLPSLLNARWLAEQIQRQMGGTPEQAQAFIRTVISAVRAAPDLARCNPESIFGGMFAAAQLGLEVGGPLGQSYLIPRKDRNDEEYGWNASFQIGYPGLIKLAANSGLVVGVDTVKIMKGDRFVRAASSERGKFFDLEFGDEHDSTDDNLIEGVIGFVMIRGADRPQWRYLSRSQIEARRPDYTKQQEGRNGVYTPNTPWKTDWGAMAEKTVVREALKFAPKSTHLAYAVAIDEAVLSRSEGSSETTVAKDGIPGKQEMPDRPALGPGSTTTSGENVAPPAEEMAPPPPDPEGVAWLPNGDYDQPPEDFWAKSGPELGRG